MKELRETYFSIQMTLFPVLGEEKIKISDKIKEFVELIEAIKPAAILMWKIKQEMQLIQNFQLRTSIPCTFFVAARGNIARGCVVLRNDSVIVLISKLITSAFV